MTRRLRALPALLFMAACGAAGADGNQAANNMAAAETPIAPPADARAAGRYRLAGSPDEVAELILHPDGRFQFGLAAGAVDGRAEGGWASDGRTVTLNTSPRPRPPEFQVGPVTRRAGTPVSILVNGPDGQGIAGVDLRVGYAGGRTVDGYTQDYGWQPNGEDARGTPEWVEIALAMYGVPPRRFPLDMRAGNQFVFTLIPNDIGVVDFRDRVFEITGRDLVTRSPDGSSATFRRTD